MTIYSAPGAPVSDLAFTDTFPAGMTITGGGAHDCGAGTLSAPVGGSTFAFSGGTLAPSASCTLTVQVPAPGPGTFNNVSDVLTSSPGSSGGAPADLIVSAGIPGFSKSFSPGSVQLGDPAMLTFTIDNTANASPALLASFTDTLPTGLTIANPSGASTDCPGGAVTAPPGGGTISFTNGSLTAGTSCTVSVGVIAGAAGALFNRSGWLTSFVGVSTVSSGSAVATLNVAAAPLVQIRKDFTDDPAIPGGTVTLDFTLTNANRSFSATGVAFTDELAAMLAGTTFTSLNSNTCNGTVGGAGTTTLSLTGGTLAAGASCDISVPVQALLAGAFVNVTEDLTSTLGNAGSATDTLTVNPLPLELLMSFTPSTIPQFQTSTVRFAFRNNATIAATSMTLTDVLPAGVTIASPEVNSTNCGAGTVSAPAGGTTISMTGGSLPASGICNVAVIVTSATVGSYPDTTEAASSSLGVSIPASATLIVEELSSASVTFVVNSDTDGIYGFSSANPLLTFPVEVNGGAGIAGPINVDTGTHVVTASAPAGVAITALSCSDDDSPTDPVLSTMTLNLAVSEVVTCTITAQASQQQTVEAINRFLTKRAGLILSSEPNLQRRIDRLNAGFGEGSPLTFANGDLVSMLPFSAQINPSRGDLRFSSSLLQARQAAASIELAHGSTKNMAFVENHRFDAWFEVQIKHFDADAEGEGSFAIAYMGADYLLSPDVLLGVTLQFDTMSDASTALNSNTRGTGWMLGPYITARLGQNLYFDARVAAGTSSNEVSPFNTYTDRFDTDRWLAMVNLSGEFDRSAWTIRPSASLAYFEESQSAYVDSVGGLIPGQTVSLGEFKLGPTFTGRFEGADGQIYAPYFGFDAIYNLGDTSGVTLTNPDTPLTEGWRGRLKAGVNMTTDTGTRLSLGATYDGLGRSDFEAFGLEFNITIPLQGTTSR